MDDLRTKLLGVLVDGTNRILGLFVLATLLGVASLVLFFVRDSGSPTRLQFVLLAGAIVVIFYMTFESNTR
jgi:hypothetical protein